MNILFVSVECYPFVKVGGLGDVVGSLPKELNKLGNEARVILPLFKTIDPELLKDKIFIKSFDIVITRKINNVNLYKLEYNGIIYYFLENEKYFGRDSVYNYPDEEERWALFQMAAIEAVRYMNDFRVDIMHCHDWHTAMIPHLIKRKYFQDFGYIKTVFTIHNMLFQGQFEKQTIQIFNIPMDKFALEHDSKLNFMKGGIQEADYVNTVSETYAVELLSSDYYSMGLLPYLAHKSYQRKFKGILNGIDYEVFNPETDKSLFKNYDSTSYKKGKEENKKQLCKKFKLSYSDKTPLIGLVSRLTKQKGLDLIMQTFDDLLKNEDFNFVVVGTGDEVYENYFRELESKYPKRVKAYIGYSNELANQVYAASDLFLMPSAFEPCGLGQMIALRYGTLPLVRETGGLRDSVIPFNEYTSEGNGFSFANYLPNELSDCVRYALKIYTYKDKWDAAIANAFASDYSFEASAKKYNDMYIETMNNL